LAPARQAGPPGKSLSAPTEAARPRAVAARKRLPLPWLVGGGVLGVAVVVAAIVLFWQTPHGTVRIESDDPSVEIVFDKTGPIIKGAGKEPISLRVGEHGILVRRGDFAFETDKMLIEKDKTITLKLELLPGKMQLVQDGKVLGSKDIPLPKIFTNSLGMEFVLVPKGKSWLNGGGGTEHNAFGWNWDPGDKEVEITNDFYLGKYEVTQEEWEKVMGSNPSFFSRIAGGKDAVKDISQADLKRFPVEQVSWDNAQLFLLKLNEQDKKVGWLYRLPKEVEWEFACRGGPLSNRFEGSYDFYLDKRTNQLQVEQANFAPWAAPDKGLKRTCKVGSYKPNALGFYDMHGNVCEWCEDKAKDEKGVWRRVVRGGSWDVDSLVCRTASRNAYPPSFSSYYSLGLRVARVPGGK
jgi:formylglycine-generating enzyme required for sulfatase activity